MTALMSLGQFVFGLATLAPETEGRETSWRFAQGPRVGARPSNQFLGPDTDGVTLRGVLWPELIGDADALEQLRQMGDTGQAFPLVDGGGRNRGGFIIEKVHEDRSLFFPDGAPQKIEFSLDLRRDGDPPPTAAVGAADEGYFFDDDFNDATGGVEDGGFTGGGSGAGL